jgi:hypothetical protein
LLIFAQTGQETSEGLPATKLESLLITKGNLIIKETIELGGIDFGKVKFDALVLYEQGKENQKTKGIRVIIMDSKTPSIFHNVFLDIEEVSSLKKSIEYMIEMAPKLKLEQKNIDIIYTTKGNFLIGFNHNFGVQQFYVSYGHLADTTYIFEIEKMNAIKVFAEKGLGVLQGLS